LASNVEQVIIPNAFLQEPFINLDENGMEYNLAYIGFAIAHELSHSLDDIGSKYDYLGNIYNWWTEKDTKKFKEIQENIAKQYKSLYKDDNLKYNYDPRFTTVSEEIADISSLNICEEYLRDFNIQNKYTPIINYQKFKQFYIYFAYQMRQTIEKRALNFINITNPHPFDKYRTNVTLSRSPFFRSMFDIKPGDKMYWNNTNGIWD
jgi:putative endopeptidase